jgi:hypothetical protein
MNSKLITWKYNEDGTLKGIQYGNYNVVCFVVENEKRDNKMKGLIGKGKSKLILSTEIFGEQSFDAIGKGIETIIFKDFEQFKKELEEIQKRIENGEKIPVIIVDSI